LRFDKVKICFHGTAEKNLSSIVTKGFACLQINDVGYYGKGIYSTSYPEYAAKYAPYRPGRETIEYGEHCSLIVSYVYIGNVKKITELCCGKEIEACYDSHHVIVNQDDNMPARDGGAIFDEYVVRKGTQMLPFYIIRLKRINTVFIWKDPTIEDDPHNSSLLMMLSEFYTIYGAPDTTSTIKLIKLKSKYNKVYLICNGRDSENLVIEARKILSTTILIYCENVAYHESWAKKYSPIAVTNNHDDVIKYVDSNYEN